MSEQRINLLAGSTGQQADTDGVMTVCGRTVAFHCGHISGGKEQHEQHKRRHTAEKVIKSFHRTFLLGKFFLFGGEYTKNRCILLIVFSILLYLLEKSVFSRACVRVRYYIKKIIGFYPQDTLCCTVVISLQLILLSLQLIGTCQMYENL